MNSSDVEFYIQFKSLSHLFSKRDGNLCRRKLSYQILIVLNIRLILHSSDLSRKKRNIGKFNRNVNSQLTIIPSFIQTQIREWKSYNNIEIICIAKDKSEKSLEFVITQIILWKIVLENLLKHFKWVQIQRRAFKHLKHLNAFLQKISIFWRLFREHKLLKKFFFNNLVSSWLL